VGHLHAETCSGYGEDIITTYLRHQQQHHCNHNQISNRSNIVPQIRFSNERLFTTKFAPSDMELGDELGHGVLKKEMEDVHVDEISPEAVRLQRFREWLLVNGVQFHGCEIRASSKEKQAGLGVFATEDNTQGVLMVTPLILAITPMTVLQDPLLGPQYCSLFEEGDVDDRLLIMLFLLIEHARGESSFWAPYLDVLPSKFGTPLSYSEEELLELKGSSLFHATQQQLRALSTVFKKTVKTFAENVLSSIACERIRGFQKLGGMITGTGT